MLRETSRLPRKYELMTIISPDVAEDALPAMIDRVGEFITAAGGTIIQTLRESPWGRRRLAYPIRYAGRDVRDGFYTVYHFDAQPGAIAEIERDLRITDQVIRFLVTHYIPQPFVEPAVETPVEVAESETAETEAPEEIEVEGEETPGAETPTAEIPAVEAEAEAPVTEAPASEEAEAPVKRRATRRKKTVDAEESQTTDEPASE